MLQCMGLQMALPDLSALQHARQLSQVQETRSPAESAGRFHARRDSEETSMPSGGLQRKNA
jgi:hypothetical protein